MRLVVLILCIVLPYIVNGQDYSYIKKSIPFSESLKKAKTYRNIDKALLNPEDVISLKINPYTDTHNFDTFIANINKFQNLRKIVIDNFFDLNLILPENFWTLQKLEFISFHNVHIESFNGMDSLTNLKYLSLLGSRISTFPNEIFSLKKLEFLDFTLNFLSDIPSEIASLSNLRELDLTNNCFTDIPIPVTQLSTLEYLDLNNAENAKQFQDGTPFCENKLSSFPDISKMTSIKRIHIYKIKFDNDQLIEQIGQMKNQVFFKKVRK